MLLEEEFLQGLVETTFCSLWKIINNRHYCTKYSSRDVPFLKAIRENAPMPMIDGGDGFVSARESKLKEKHSADCFAMFDQEANTGRVFDVMEMQDRICSEHHEQLLACTVQKMTCLASTFADVLNQSFGLGSCRSIPKR